LNDYDIVGEVELHLNPSLWAYSATGGPSGGGTLLLVPITNPISPGTAQPFDFWVQAGPQASATLPITGIVRYWPKDGASGVENKDANKTISWDTSFRVDEKSESFGVPRDIETGTFDQGADNAEDIETGAVDQGADNTEDLKPVVDGGFDDWNIVIIAILAVLGVLAVVAIFRIIMN
jgi:hypothetical protein